MFRKKWTDQEIDRAENDVDLIYLMNGQTVEDLARMHKHLAMERTDREERRKRQQKKGGIISTLRKRLRRS
jgi:hypothetical protein